MLDRDRHRGCLLGLAVGDAVGTTLEFTPRTDVVPIDDMVGGGPFGLRPGAWTDDTSMALCLATSLIERDGFDARDQMDRYCRWAETGYLSSTGTCFDIGGTVGAALARYKRTGEPESGSIDPRSAGNGSIMRLAPIPLFFAADPDLAIDMAAASSRTTHGTAEAVDACRFLAAVLIRALRGESKEEVLLADRGVFRGEPKIRAIVDGGYLSKTDADVRGSGYVVQSLEAALWCFDRAADFRTAVLLAANLGEDADTTAAITGQVAGAFYGLSGIPRAWRARVVMRDQILALADQLFTAGKRSNNRLQAGGRSGPGDS